MKRLPIIIAIVFAIIYAAYWSWFTIARHHTTNSTRFDLGNAEQVIWNATQGNIFRSTDPYGTQEVSRLVYHADLFLLALVPFYAAAPGAETLLILQSLALASSVLAVFLLARFWLKRESWAAALAGVFALTPGLHWLNAFDFHAVAFAVPLILWCLVMAEKKRYGWMLVLAGLAMLTKEEIGFSLLPIAAYLFFRAKQKGWALMMLLPAVYAGIMMFVVIPNLQAGRVNPDDVFRSPFGNSATAVISNILTHPKQIIELSVSPTTIHYGLQLLVPFGFLPLGHWLVLGATPDGLINIVSGKETQQTIFFHYQAGMLPWLAIATIAFITWTRRRFQRSNWTPVLIGWLIIWAGVGTWLYGPLPGAKLDYSRVVSWQNPYADPIRNWAKKIPAAAAVSVTNNVGAHFAQRRELYSFPLGLNQSDYAVVLEGRQLPEVATQAEVTSEQRRLTLDSDWTVVFQQGDLSIFQRRPGT